MHLRWAPGRVGRRTAARTAAPRSTIVLVKAGRLVLLFSSVIDGRYGSGWPDWFLLAARKQSAAEALLVDQSGRERGTAGGRWLLGRHSLA
eukprot:scaffold231842_cov32-Tisochrysis_lutea.AAC.3